jgi:hypothetical protein
MEDVKIGDYVRCKSGFVGEGGTVTNDTPFAGAGYEEGLVFKVISCETRGPVENRCYYGGLRNYGVYGKALELHRKGHDFKVGDRLRMIRDYCQVADEGDIVVVTEVDNDGDVTFMNVKTDDTCFGHNDSLAHVTESTEVPQPSFKVGDTVKIIGGDDDDDDDYLGQTATIVRVDSDDGSKPLYELDDHGGGWLYPAKSLALSRVDVAAQQSDVTRGPTYKPGDWVRVLKSHDSPGNDDIAAMVGKICKVKEDDGTVPTSGSRHVAVYQADEKDYWWFKYSELEPAQDPQQFITKSILQGDTTMSSTFYKVIKETPELVEGAILQVYSGNVFTPISDLWNQDDVAEGDEVRVTKPGAKKTYYERVWASTDADGRTVYVDKATARDLLNGSVTLKTVTDAKATK